MTGAAGNTGKKIQVGEKFLPKEIAIRSLIGVNAKMQTGL